MPVCKKIKSKKRKVCIGDLTEEITLLTRSIDPPITGEVDFIENFGLLAKPFALVKTVRGETIFDSTNTEKDITHHFYIRHIDNLTSEVWIQYKLELYDILDVENLDERKEFILIRAKKRGPDDVLVNQA